LIALLVVESTDLIFALDSIPAIFAITLDPFIVFSSNVFAILGLRSLYFLVGGSVERFAYLKYGLAAVLVFVGMKMLVAEIYEVPVVLSLAAIVALLGASIAASMLRCPGRRQRVGAGGS
jgi:tellurite resistance protein TerC